MKRTFTINISGIIFHIDEDAYEYLNAYLDRIKKHFSGREGGDEVVTDIEARISEILHEKLSETRQVITLEDIREVISVMGEPGQMEGESAPAGEERRRAKRLYRDPEQRILGGVCGGLGVYFRLDPLFFRLLFVLLAFSGFGILLYLVLWAVTPLATTVSDRLEMHGEPVNIASIERTARQEWEQVRGKLNEFAAGAKDAYRRTKPGIGTFLEGLGNALLVVLKAGWWVLRVILGICILLIGVALGILVIVALVGWGMPLFTDNGDFIMSLPVAVRVFLNASVSPGFVQLMLGLFLGIPVLMLFYGGLRMTFNIPKVEYAGVTAFNVWLVSLLVLGYLTIKTVNSYRMPMTRSTTFPSVSGVKGDTIFLGLDTRLPDSLKDAGTAYVIRQFDLNVTEDSRILLRPRLTIGTSRDSSLSMTAMVTARGRDPESTRRYLEEIRYAPGVNDSAITFSPLLMLPQGEGWHARKVALTLLVPEGRFVKFDSSLYRMMDPLQRPSPAEMAGKVYKMTGDGLVEVSP